MTKTKALALARGEIVQGMDGRSIHIFQLGWDSTRVIQATDYDAAQAHVTELRFERTLELLGYSADEAHYLSALWDYGRLEDRVNSALETKGVGGQDNDPETA